MENSAQENKTFFVVPDVNQVTFSGRVAQVPNLKYAPSGTAVCSFNVAVTRLKRTGRMVNEKPEYEGSPVFLKVAVFGKEAEVHAKNLTKGMQVFVSGELDSDDYMMPVRDDKGEVLKTIKTSGLMRIVNAQVIYGRVPKAKLEVQPVVEVVSQDELALE